MTFFNPWAFGFAGLVPVIIALYLLKVRRRPVAISTLMFWQRVLQENERRALFQKLRHNAVAGSRYGSTNLAWLQRENRARVRHRSAHRAPAHAQARAA